MFFSLKTKKKKRGGERGKKSSLQARQSQSWPTSGALVIPRAVNWYNLSEEQTNHSVRRCHHEDGQRQGFQQPKTKKKEATSVSITRGL